MKIHSLMTAVELAFILLCAGGGVESVYAENAETQKKAKKPQIPVVQKDGKKARRRCFKDANQDGYCDNGSEQQWKCPNNCRSVESIEKEQREKEQKESKDKKSMNEDKAKASALPCGNCPHVGACHGECLALFKLGSRCQQSR